MKADDFPPGTLRQRVRRQSLEVTVEGFRRVITQVGRTLAPEEDWTPVLLLESRTEERLIVPLGPLFHESLGSLGKDVAAAVMPQLVEAADAWLAGFVTTAWMVEETQEEIELAPDGKTLLRGTLPSEDPRRVEIVGLFVVSAETDEYHSAEVVRRPGRPPALRPWRRFSGEGTALGGRFGDALRVAFGKEPYEPKEEA